MSPQQNMANGNWPIPQRSTQNWNQPSIQPSGNNQIPGWLQTLVTAYSQQPQQVNHQPMDNSQYQAQPQSQSSTPTLVGRHIQDISEIKPIEVPMDGTATYFPTVDGSAIYLKYWDQDGQIKGIRYVPEVTPNEVVAMESKQPSFPTVQEINDAILPTLSSLDTRLAAIEAALLAKTPVFTQPTRGNSSKSKKEDNDNA